jgi:hypothetical protein
MEEDTKPTYQLYSPGQVTLATLLGTPVAGAILMASNYRGLGDPKQARSILIGGAIFTAALIILAFVLPEDFPGVSLAVPSVVAMHVVAKKVQGPAYDEHLRKGGEKASGWQAAGIGVLCLVVVFGGTFAVVFSASLLDGDEPEAKVVFGPGEEVYYVDGATEGEAQILGLALTAFGFFGTEGPKSVFLARSSDGFRISFCMQEGAWDDEETVRAFKNIAKALSADVFDGRPVETHICDEELVTKKVIPAEPAARPPEPE